MSDLSSYEEHLLDFFNNLYQIGYLLVFPIVCSIGFLLSLVCLRVLMDGKLKEKVYFYLGIKTFTETFLLVIGALTPLVVCVDCSTHETYISTLTNLVS